MKRIYTSGLCVMALITMASCKDNGIDGPEEPSVSNVSWPAHFEHFVSEEGLEPTVDWSANEAISVFANKKNNNFEAESYNGYEAVFAGSIQSAKTYYALYPYSESATNSSDNITSSLPETQALVAGGVDPAALLAVSRTSGNEFDFRNMVALIAVKVSGDIRSLSVSGASEDDRIAGKVRMNTGTGKVTMITGTERIALEGVPQSGKTYYVAVAPGTLSGIVVTGVNEKGLSAEIRVSDEITLESSSVMTCEADFSKVDWVLRPPVGQSYVISGAKELEEFCAFEPNPKEEVVDLTIKGDDITDAMLAKVSGRVGAVLGNLVWENLGASGTAGFFDRIDCQKGITLKDCAALASASGFDRYTRIGGDLVIGNCPGLGRGFNALETVSGSLKLDNSGAVFGDNQSFASLAEIGGNMEIMNCGSAFTSFSGASLATIGGDINVTDNASLHSLEGMDHLTHIGGNVVILDNGAIPVVSDGESAGFCVIREYLNKNIISSTANVKLGTSSEQIDLSELPSCDGTKPGAPQSYTLNGTAEVEAFVKAGITNETVNNLTITGDVSTAALCSIIQRVYTVKGTLTIENITYVENPDSTPVWGIGTNGFLGGLAHNRIFEGSIVLRNLAGTANNPDGFKEIHEIKGDLIIDGCPGLCFHWAGEAQGALYNIKKVGGDLKIMNSSMESSRGLDGTILHDLEEVGGSFVLEGMTNIWFMKGMSSLRSIGGDLVIKDLPLFWGLNGFENLSYLGGNVVISNYGKLQVKNGEVDGQDCIGMCVLRDFVDNKVMNQDATVTIIKDGSQTDFSTILSCSATYEGDKNGGNEKYPDPDTVTGWN
ncbi:MAG: hypothetical protein NC308_02690 [Clostridium sp.]|nr:hypothetical protein [Bacteroides sp.]MCM1197772.1 hypothetical protein [Clostridium sp.]